MYLDEFLRFLDFTLSGRDKRYFDYQLKLLDEDPIYRKLNNLQLANNQFLNQIEFLEVLKHFERNCDIYILAGFEQYLFTTETLTKSRKHIELLEYEQLLKGSGHVLLYGKDPKALDLLLYN